jgi:hypothetical protein
MIDYIERIWIERGERGRERFREGVGEREHV